MEIAIVEKKEEINFVLNEFSNCLLSLQKGERYRCKMAEKFAKHGIFINAVENGMIKGFAAFYANDMCTRTAYLSMIAVLPQFRGEHIGQKILNECIRMAEMQCMEKMELEVGKNNIKAICFYQKNEFKLLEKESQSSFYMQRRIGGKS